MRGAGRWSSRRAFGWGFGGSFLALLLTTPLRDALSRMVSPSGTILIQMLLLSPVLEEHLKAVPAWLAVRSLVGPPHPQGLRRLGAWSGGGFALAEAGLYATFAASQTIALATTVVLARLLVTLPLHALTGALSAGAMGATARSGRACWWGLAPAILLHAGYNLAVLRLGGAL